MAGLRTLLLVAIVALAGCAGGPINGTVTPTGEPTATPPPVEEAPFPTGASADGVNETQVAEGHRAALHDAGSYSMTSNFTTVVRGQTSSLNITVRVDFADNAAIGASTIRRQGEEQENRIYARNGTGFLRITSQNSTEYNRLTGNTSAHALTDQLSGNTIRDVLQRFEFAATATERRDGEVLIIYKSTAVTGGGTGEGSLPAGSLSNNSSATVVIDQSGVVRGLSVGAIFQSGPRAHLSLSHSKVGTATVERPDWADRAESETTPVPTTPEVQIETSQKNATIETANGTVTAPVVTLRHAGGDAVERSKLEVMVFTDGRQAAGYDVNSLAVPDGQLESTDPLNGTGSLEAGRSIRIVHVVPKEHHDSIRLDPASGTLTAGDGAITDGRLASGDSISLVWTGKQRPRVIATYEVA